MPLWCAFWRRLLPFSSTLRGSDIVTPSRLRASPSRPIASQLTHASPQNECSLDDPYSFSKTDDYQGDKMTTSASSNNSSLCLQRRCADRTRPIEYASCDAAAPADVPRYSCQHDHLYELHGGQINNGSKPLTRRLGFAPPLWQKIRDCCLHPAQSRRNTTAPQVAAVALAISLAMEKLPFSSSISIFGKCHQCIHRIGS